MKLTFEKENNNINKIIRRLLFSLLRVGTWRKKGEEAGGSRRNQCRSQLWIPEPLFYRLLPFCRHKRWNILNKSETMSR
jgi:hypothetical protein